MDETFQQAVSLMQAYLQGNFLTGLILPPGSALPSSDLGPIAMGGTWYFFDPGSGQYQPQSVPVKAPKNFARNPVYQVAQNGTTFSPGVGATNTFDMTLTRATVSGVLGVSADTGPAASPDNDDITTSIKYTVNNIVASLASTDLFAHEHLFEGADLVPLQGQTLSLAFSVMVNAPGVYSAYLTSSGRDESIVFSFQVSTANVWQRIKIQGIPALPTTGTWHFGEGQTGLYFGVGFAVGTQWQTSITAAWHSAFLAGTASNANMMAVIGNTIKITGVKLEANPSCTPITVNNFDEDYNQVVRYFLTNFSYQSSSAGVPISLQAPKLGTWLANTIFARRMCKAPTVVPYGYQSFASGQITNFKGGTAVDIPVANLAAVQKGISDSQTVGAGTGATINGTITAITLTGNTTNLASNITNVTAASAANVLPGATISGAGIPAGATVISYNPSSQTLYISAPATATATGVTLTFSSPIIGSMSTLTGVTIGGGFSGTGVPPGTTVVSILSSSSIQASNPIPPGTIPLTFGAPVLSAGDPLLCFFKADARLT
jgi:hypothetical protein